MTSGRRSVIELWCEPAHIAADLRGHLGVVESSLRSAELLICADAGLSPCLPSSVDLDPAGAWWVVGYDIEAALGDNETVRRVTDTRVGRMALEQLVSMTA